MNSIIHRTSVRHYLKKPLSKQEIKSILQAGFSAPSAKNLQPWSFIVVEDSKKLADLSVFSPYASFLKESAMGIVVCADTNINPSLDYCQQDCAAATQNMLIEAKELGIGSCWLGGYPNLDRVAYLVSYFHLPENIVPLWMVSFGYPNEPIKVKEKWEDSKIRYE